MSRLYLPLLLAVLTSFPALSQAKQSSLPIVDAERKEGFADQAAAIRQQMKTGGRFEYVTTQERSEVERQLDIITALLEKRAGERLSDNDQLDLLAAQETANAILTQRDGHRLICEFSAPTGSNRKVKQCATYADRARAHKETRNYMRENMGKNPLNVAN
ncbi:MAG: hypothetical protein JNN30_17860 [Rhodanobacteraceae bacterium]|nr:hypothetical protein [Rhodanobacteraceae bacterium]